MPLLFAACAYISADDAAARRDMDGDGALGDVDCDDTDPARYPGASEEPCDDVDRDCDGRSGASDGDADGVTACTDCDDGDSAVFPGAVEVCNGVDDDCDGSVDIDVADPPTWYYDGDGDAFGSDAEATAACDAPLDYVATGGDCDDTDDSVFPGAQEDCDEVDRDCDGDPTAGAGDAPTWFRDEDGDGWGADDDTTLACVQPDDFVDVAGDCDDQAAGVSPGATEVCDDGIDNDCSGDGNDCALVGTYTVSDVATRLEGTESGNFGYALGGGLDLDGDGTDDLVVGAPDLGGGVHVYLADDTGPLARETTLPISSVATDDGAGDALAVGVGVGPSGGVGILAGVSTCDDAGADFGAVVACEYDGGRDTFDCPVALLGAAEGDRLGWAATATHDGSAFSAVGAVGSDAAGQDAGAVYLFGGPHAASGSVGAVADGVVTGEQARQQVGYSLGKNVIDLDGDGVAEWVAGAPGTSSAAGAAYLLPVDTSASSFADATARLDGEQAGDSAGRCVDSVGDLDGDGYGELVVGASSYSASSGSREGALYVVRGPVGSGSLALAHARLLGEPAAFAGWSCAALGDTDGDGTSDFGVGAYGGAGTAYVFRGLPSAGAADLAVAAALVLGGEASGDKLGTAFSPAGDLDADGNGEFLVGAHGWGSTDAGAAYVIFGEGG